MKLFEYMSKGKALILSEIPTVKEILKKKEYIGLPKNIDDSNFIKILKNCDSRTYGRKSFNLIKKFTWEKRATRFINLIKKSI